MTVKDLKQALDNLEDNTVVKVNTSEDLLIDYDQEIQNFVVMGNGEFIIQA